MSDEIPEIEATPEYVVEVVEAMFTIVPNSGHAPEHFPCRFCGEWQAQALARVREGGEPMKVLRAIRDTMPEPDHPYEGCIPCYGCRWEQQYAVDLIREVLD